MWNKIKSLFWDFLFKKIRKQLHIAECRKCHIESQQLKNGLCIKCEKEMELNGAIEELNSIRNKPLGGLDYDQAKYRSNRISELESKIPRLKGELRDFNTEKNLC